MGAAKDIENYSRLEGEFKSSQEYVLALEKSVESLTDTQAQIERGLIDKSKEVAVLRSDMVLLQQDLEQRNIECMNLKVAVDSLHQAQDLNAKKSAEKFAKQLKVIEAQVDEKLAQNDELWKVELGKQNELRVELEQKLGDEALLRRKAEIDMNTEKRRLQKLLEDAMNQLRHVREDVVDRTLVANLIVSYFQRNK